MKLYTAQENAVTRIAGTAQPVRHVLAAATGTGKTAMAISALQRLGAETILVVTFAIVRRHWAAEFDRWWPGHPETGVIEVGRDRKLSKPKAQRRDAAYRMPVQIVSYDLLPEVEPEPWQAIVFDECHALGNPTTKQSAMARALVDSNPTACLLMLSATPVPTVVKQLWHILYLLEGADRWGELSKSGDVNWQFGRKFLHIAKSEYGTYIENTQTPEQAADLRTALAPIMTTLTEADIAPDMPPLRLSLLQTERTDKPFYSDWIKALEADIYHAGVFVHLRETAAMVADLAQRAGRVVVSIDGSIPAGDRSARLETAAKMERCFLVATYDSLSVGIRLLFLQKALITEFQSSPGKMTQVLGRFASVGSTARPIVQFAVTHNNHAMAQRLVERIAVLNNSIQTQNSTNQLSTELGILNQQRETDVLGSFLDDVNLLAGEFEGDDDTE